MKLTRIFLVAVIISFAFFQAFAASEEVNIKYHNDNGSYYVYVDAESIPSQDTAVTAEFSIPAYDGVNWTVYPVNYTKKQTAVGSPNITTTIEGSDDLVNWAVVDTIGAVGDSAETFQTGTLDFNSGDSTNFKNKFRYYRLKFIGLATNDADAVTTVWLKFIKRES